MSLKSEIWAKLIYCTLDLSTYLILILEEGYQVFPCVGGFASLDIDTAEYGVWDTTILGKPPTQ